MELRDLRLFVAVAEELHFTRAATRSNIAQPALSQAIRKLERELGVSLFERTTRHVTLTDAGLVMMRQASTILSAVDLAVDDVRRAHSGDSGTLRVGFTTLAPHRLLARLAEAHGTLYPDVRLRPTYVPSLRQVELLRGQELDAGLLWRLEGREDAERSGIQHVLLAHQRIMAVMPKGHALAHRHSISVDELARESFVTYPPTVGGSVISAALWNACTEAGFTPNIVQEGPDAYSILCIISARVGVTLLPECAVDMGVGGIAMVALKPPVYGLDYVLAWRAGDSRAILRNLLDTVVDLESGDSPL